IFSYLYILIFLFSSRRRHTRFSRDWSSDVCSSDLTLWGIILPGLGTAFGTFLLRQHFKALPREIFEAAELDGAGHVRKLFQIAEIGRASCREEVRKLVVLVAWYQQ